MLNLSRQEAISTPLDQFDKLPEKPGVYILRISEGKPVYVGKASAIKSRVIAHLRPRFEIRLVRASRIRSRAPIISSLSPQ